MSFFSAICFINVQSEVIEIICIGGEIMQHREFGFMTAIKSIIGKLTSRELTSTNESSFLCFIMTD